MKVLGVIPARGGSKGVPGKNIRLLGNQSLIEYTIAACKASQRLVEYIVSTDDLEIAAVARSAGAAVPFIRPGDLATDQAKAIPVIRHALMIMEGLNNMQYDAVMMLQPTTPFRTGNDIDSSIAILEKSGADSVISVVDVTGHHPARMKFLSGDRLIDPEFCEAYENQPRQELPPMYIRNGAIYLTKRDVLLSGSFKGQDCRAYLMETIRSVNIDTMLDFEYAEFLLKHL